MVPIACLASLKVLAYPTCVPAPAVVSFRPSARARLETELQYPSRPCSFRTVATCYTTSYPIITFTTGIDCNAKRPHAFFAGAKSRLQTFEAGLLIVWRDPRLALHPVPPSRLGGRPEGFQSLLPRPRSRSGAFAKLAIASFRVFALLNAGPATAITLSVTLRGSPMPTSKKISVLCSAKQPKQFHKNRGTNSHASEGIFSFHQGLAKGVGVKT